MIVPVNIRNFEVTGRSRISIPHSASEIWMLSVDSMKGIKEMNFSTAQCMLTTYNAADILTNNSITYSSFKIYLAFNFKI